MRMTSLPGMFASAESFPCMNVFGFCKCHLQAFAKLARFLIICCDGVSDVKTNEQALENVCMNMQCVLWVFAAKWYIYLSIYSNLI